MTKSDKVFLIHFLTRTGMYIYPIDIHNIQSFITGYETGRKDKCHFYNNCKELLSVKYKIEYSSAGLLGQIKKVAKKMSLPEVVIFKKIALEVISIEKTDTKAIHIFKSRIADLISRIKKDGDPCYNETWKDEWLSLVSIKQQWFIQLWGKKELAALKSIDKEVLANAIFKHRQQRIPTTKMLSLKEKFEQTTRFSQENTEYPL